MTIYPIRMYRTSKSPLIQCAWFLAGGLLGITGVILGYAPLVPIVYGLSALVIASLCFAQASMWCERQLNKLPFIGKDLIACRTTGISPRMERKFIFMTTAFMGCVVYANPEAWQTILWYCATIPLIHMVTYLWNKKLRS